MRFAFTLRLSSWVACRGEYEQASQTKKHHTHECLLAYFDSAVSQAVMPQLQT